MQFSAAGVGAVAFATKGMASRDALRLPPPAAVRSAPPGAAAVTRPRRQGRRRHRRPEGAFSVQCTMVGTLVMLFSVQSFSLRGLVGESLDWVLRAMLLR